MESCSLTFLFLSLLATFGKQVEQDYFQTGEKFIDGKSISRGILIYLFKVSSSHFPSGSTSRFILQNKEESDIAPPMVGKSAARTPLQAAGICYMLFHIT